MKKYIPLLLLILASKAQGQIVLGYFPFNYGEVQLTSPQEYLLFADVRLETNSFISNLNMELGGAVNLLRRSTYNFYLGAGLRLNPFMEESKITGYYFPVGVRWRPLQAIPQLGLVFELSPAETEGYGPGYSLRSKLGLSYAF